MLNAIKDLSVSSSSPIGFEVEWHSSWSDKWYQSQGHGFESWECHCERGIVGGTTTWLPTTTLKIGSHGVMLNAIKDLSVFSITNWFWNGIVHGPTKMFCKYFTGKSYLRDTREILQAGMTLCFQSCAVQMALSRDSFSRGTREIHLFIVLSLSLHHLLHSTLTIKNSHKYRKIRLNKLESNLAWN